MRHSKRVLFATPFVLIASACGSGYKSGHNPPAPHKMAADQCEAVVANSECGGYPESCDIPREDGCGLVGYDCRDGKWQERMNLCNPPPPTGNTMPVDKMPSDQPSDVAPPKG